MTVIERTTKTRLPSSAQATPTMMATPASAKNAARHGGSAAASARRLRAAPAARPAPTAGGPDADGGAMYSA